MINRADKKKTAYFYQLNGGNAMDNYIDQQERRQTELFDLLREAQEAEQLEKMEQQAITEAIEKGVENALENLINILK